MLSVDPFNFFAVVFGFSALASIVPTNSCYDTTTGISGDNIHPSNVGHRQIFTCAIPYLQGGVKPEGSLFYAAGYLYFNDESGNNKVLLGEGTGADDVQVTTSTANPPFQVFNYIIKI